MAEVKFEEFNDWSHEDQLQHVKEQLKRVRETKKKHAESIKQLEGFIENCNESIEALLELKFNVLHKQRLSEIQENVFGK